MSISTIFPYFTEIQNFVLSFHRLIERDRKKIKRIKLELTLELDRYYRTFRNGF